VGVIGTGRIGSVFANIMNGFGCQVLAYDLKPNQELKNVEFTSLDVLLKRSDIISLHVPLTPKTIHLLDESAFNKMKPGALLINTGRGALIQTKDLISALKRGHLGGAGLDVYEEEENIFFHDLSGQIMQDDQLARLMTFPNVLITAHQGFLTKEALTNIMTTTLQNISDFENGRTLVNAVTLSN
jgi:D-lactate dehydrogenase